MAFFASIVEKLFFLYCLLHIPIALLIDAQALLPKHLYHDVLLQTVRQFSHDFKDPFMLNPPKWFQSFIACELVFQVPYFFVGAYAFLKGSSKCSWIRIPTIVYCTHTITTMLPIAFHVFFEDFSKNGSGPSNMPERLRLFAIYSPFLIIPTIMLLKMLFFWNDLSSQKQPLKNEKQSVKNEQQSRKKNK